MLLDKIVSVIELAMSVPVYFEKWKDIFKLSLD